MDQTYGPTMMPGPPGMEAPPPPGWMGMTPQALGYGVPKYGPQAGVQGMQQAQAQAGSMFGGSVMNAAAGAAHTGYQMTSFGAMTVAPLLASYGSTMAIRGVGTAWSMTDPFQVGMVGGRAGWAMAEGAGMGMGGRLAMGAMGMTTVGAAAAMPLLAAQSWIEHSLKGARDAMLGRSTLQSVAASHGGAFGHGQVSAGQGASFGHDLGDLSKQMGTSTDELASLTKQLDQMKVFQSTRNVSEFRSKFKEVLGAIKEIATTTKQTLEDATQTFGELKQQGFYTTADITAQAAKRHAQSQTSGVDGATLSAYGGMGSQVARSLGMRGRFGADYMTQSVSSMATAYRGMSDRQQEIVDEHGGPEAMASSLAAKQMQHLSSARGRAMIAATLGAGGAPDLNKLGRLLGGGMSTEGIVEAAAGSGLGTLMQAGTAQTREKYMQYAGMMDISMAMSQSKQLYGGTSRQGLNTMMGTLGYSRAETEIELAKTMQMPKIMQEQAAEQTYAMQQGEWQHSRGRASWRGRGGRALDHAYSGVEQSGGRMWAGLSGSYERFANDMSGYDETTIGPEGMKMAREFAASGKKGSATLSRDFQGGAFFGGISEQERMAHNFGGYAQSVTKMAEDRTGTKRYKKADGTVIDDQAGGGVIELSGASTGDQVLIMTKRDKAEAQKALAEPVQITQENLAKMKEAVVYKDYLKSGIGTSFGALYGKGTRLEADRAIYQSQAVGLGINSEELNSYLVLKQSGIFSGSLGDWNNLKTNQDPEQKAKFLKLRQQSGALLVGSGVSRSEVENLTGDLSVSGSGIGRAGAKDHLKKSLTTLLGGGRAALIDKVTDNSEAAKALDDLMKNLGGTEASRAGALGVLEKELGGLDSPEFGDVRSLLELPEEQRKSISKAYGSSTYADNLGISDLMGQSFAAEVYGGRSDREGKAISQREGKLLAMSPEERKKRRRDNSTEAAVGALRSAGDDRNARGSAYKTIFGNLSKGGYDSEELNFLTEITGGGEAVSLALGLNDLASPDAAKRKAAAAKLGLSDSDVDAALKGKKGDAALQAAVELAAGKGALDPALWSAGGKETTVAGSEKTYVEANKEFVTAVTTFVNMLGEKFPQLQTSGEGVTQTGGSVIGNLFTGWG